MNTIVRHEGIEITVRKRKYETTWSVFFTNISGNFENLSRVGPLKGLESEEAAIAAGKKFVNDRRWQFVENVKFIEVYVRLSWDGKWGYGINLGNWETSKGRGDYKSRDEAVIAGNKGAKEWLAEMDEQIKRDRELVVKFLAKRDEEKKT